MITEGQVIRLPKDLPYGGFKKGDLVLVRELNHFPATGKTFATLCIVGEPTIGTFLLSVHFF